MSNGKRFMAYELVKRLERQKNNIVLHKLQESVTASDKDRGKKHQVFERSFDCKLITTEHFFLQKLNYIHNNPCSGVWNLVKNPVDYEHSSARHYIGEKSVYTIGWVVLNSIRPCPASARGQERDTAWEKPYGASTVNPSYGGAPRSFEEVINNVFNAYGIHTLPGDNYFCNPFTVDYPKPYGSNPPLAVNYTNTLDTCACSRFASLKMEAASLGYNTLSYTSMNGFFTANYNDTLTSVLWDGLQQCGSIYRDTCSTVLSRQEAMPAGEPTCATCTLDVYNRTDFGKPSVYVAKCEINFLADFDSDSTDDFDAYVDATLPLCDSTGCLPVYMPIMLKDFVPLPPFFNCDYIKPCISCSTLVNVLTPEFRTLYPAYSGVPYLDSTATAEQVQQNALWARFLNYRTGFSKNAIDYMAAYQNCSSGNPPANALCALDKPMNDASDIYTKAADPCEAATTQAQFMASILLQAEKDSLIANFDSLYMAKCLNIQNSEEFYVTYRPKEYHYTLYYYDQAGNLVKTLPPAAVKPDYDASFLDSVAAQRSAGNDYANYSNNEQLATNYRYNTLNQVTSQKSPDGGTSHFWYDRLGRLAVSQNAKQAAGGNYSYTIYDPLGRITEVGQKPQTTAMTQTISQDTTALQSWVVGGGLKEQITRTVYDVSYYAGEHPATLEPTLYQQNLRNRVSYSQIFDTEPSGTDPGKWAGTHTAATYYSYDIAGNVDTLLQDYKDALAIPNRYKKIVYDYDLISGKVNKVSYQRGWSDQLYHKYSYDADNRLVEVETSHDSIYWENDADYEYYRHGPLSRMVLGQNQVQGLDYAYTLQGWLKGVNSTSVNDGTFDMGGDGKTGSANSNVARDAFGYSLHYYNGDYKPISSTVTPFATVTNNLAVLTDGIHTGNDLFNGNIRAMLVNVPQLGNANLYAYRYDQLNRIKAMNAFTGFNNSTNLFTNPVATENYKERVTYDPNGNIRTYLRDGDAARVSMDDLAYTYKTNSNQLDKVVDAATDAAAGDYNKYNDIKQGQTNGNYQYDAIGNLISDASEGITNIDWNVYGKISSITKSDGTTINYSYDVSGNRINKKVTSGGVTKTTVYVRDATGNVMSIYIEDPAINSGHLTQSEADLYGSGRLGVWNMTRDVSALAAIDYSNYSSTFERGNKFFELNNHLGNVLATVSDKKIGVDTNSDGVVDYNTAEVINANDYYPFGMQMPSRKYSIANTNYRYGFNGKENDNDIENGAQDYGMRIYDGRLGRFLTVDPLSKKYPFYTPFQFAGNSPILSLDIDGMEGDINKNENEKKHDLQTADQGTGDFTTRTYEVIVTQPKASTSDILKNIENNFNSFVPNDKGYFEKIKGDPKNIKIGDEFKIIGGTSVGALPLTPDQAKNPENYGLSPLRVGKDQQYHFGSVVTGVTVTSVTKNSFTFTTWKGHVEAGTITFSVTSNDIGNLVIKIHSMTSPSNGFYQFAYDHLKGKTIQTELWNNFITNVGNTTGGQVSKPINSTTENNHSIWPW